MTKFTSVNDDIIAQTMKGDNMANRRMQENRQVNDTVFPVGRPEAGYAGKRIRIGRMRLGDGV